jgi:serine/threonine-protein kinase RsbW
MPNAPATPRRTLLRFRIAGAGEPVFKARRRIGDVARSIGFSPDEVDAILLAFSEALTNAIRHGGGVKRYVHVKAVGEPDGLVLEVADHGRGFRPDRVTLPPPTSMSEGGRGLYLMKALMDEVQWHDSEEGTLVRMMKRLGGRQ